MHWYIDHWDEHLLLGWVARDRGTSDVEEVQLLADGQVVASAIADGVDLDLLEMGFASARHVFQIDLSGKIPPDAMLLEIAVKDTNSILGIRVLVPYSTLPPVLAARLSKNRWSGYEPHEGLTWGKWMTGDAWFDALCTHVTIPNGARILEIGPGYGRLLKTLLRKNAPFEQYVGLELSEARVRELTHWFGSSKVTFEHGDVMHAQFSQRFDIAICSSTFEHLYPDCASGLANVRQATVAGGHVAIDFIEPRRGGRRSFEANGTFVRVYSENELLQLHKAAGLRVLARQTLVIGEGADGPVKRLLLVSTPSISDS